MEEVASRVLFSIGCCFRAGAHLLGRKVTSKLTSKVTSKVMSNILIAIVLVFSSHYVDQSGFLGFAI